MAHAWSRWTRRPCRPAWCPSACSTGGPSAIEGLAAPGDPLAPVQQAFKDTDVVQCGMCFPGMAISLTALLRVSPTPSDEEVRAHLSGNICRCTGYERIVAAALAATGNSGGTS